MKVGSHVELTNLELIEYCEEVGLPANGRFIALWSEHRDLLTGELTPAKLRFGGGSELWCRYEDFKELKDDV